MITLLGALGEDGGRMHGMQENEVCTERLLLEAILLLLVLSAACYSSTVVLLAFVFDVQARTPTERVLQPLLLQFTTILNTQT